MVVKEIDENGEDNVEAMLETLLTYRARNEKIEQLEIDLDFSEKQVDKFREFKDCKINLESSNKALLDLQENHRVAILTLKEKEFIISKLLHSENTSIECAKELRADLQNASDDRTSLFGKIDVVTSGDCNSQPKETENQIRSLKRGKTSSVDERVSSLYSAWSALLDGQVNAESEILQRVGLSRSSVPKAPYLENCKLSAQINERLDNRAENESFLPWTVRKGVLDIFPSSTTDEQLRYFRHQAISEGACSPRVPFLILEICGLCNSNYGI